ncbi:Serine/threonine-protein kinase PknB [Labilithrix luteola]|uniref:non-specific serine/threonine protein kinase n=1 Tax=Labilithrix luteola TaxID=1391654 RepID=A0A0K1PN82_9BACT|nr:protein kinase [Labilithrix luteola]AKU94988.1 Serine/threonine-protein kinase PknB [Labilithrix luteola]
MKVLDFGISRLIHGDEHLTKDFAPLGTMLYMSPEQIEAASRVDRRTDVWSLGVVLYEMLVGRPPFEGEGTGVLVAIVTRAVPPPSTLLDNVPPGLEAVMMRALEKSADARFQNMAEFARALSPWAPVGSTYRRGRSRKRVALVGVGVAAAIGVAAVTLNARSTMPLNDSSMSAVPTPLPSAPTTSASLAASASRPPSTAASTRRAPATRGSQTPRAGAQPSAKTTKRP